MPAFTLWRSMYCGILPLNSATNSGRSGRGPTMDISPLSTFQNCGSSSMFELRSILPSGVRRGSFRLANTGPVWASASTYIDLNVLPARQRHVQMIDCLTFYELRHVIERAEQRPTALPEMMAPPALVDEPVNLKTELAVLKDIVGDELPTIARPGNQHAFDLDA